MSMHCILFADTKLLVKQLLGKLKWGFIIANH